MAGEHGAPYPWAMPKPTPKPTTLESLRSVALAYPETREDHPWGECAFKVKDKTFLFSREEPERLTLSFKLPQSSGFALMFPFAKPTGYGMGPSGWVTCTFDAASKGKDAPPLPMLLEWLDESFRAVAPKKLLKAWDEGRP